MSFRTKKAEVKLCNLGLWTSKGGWIQSTHWLVSTLLDRFLTTNALPHEHLNLCGTPREKKTGHLVSSLYIKIVLKVLLVDIMPVFLFCFYMHKQLICINTLILTTGEIICIIINFKCWFIIKSFVILQWNTRSIMGTFWSKVECKQTDWRRIHWNSLLWINILCINAFR